jgi:hypothetical protein
MVESMSGPVTRCPWCSAPVPDPGAETCPSCSAALSAAPGLEADIKGVTTLDTEAILRARSEVVRPRSNRLLAFITGEVPAEPPQPGSPESLAPPPDAVRREMLRLQLEAERADLEAETVALKADELARLGIHVSQLGAPAASVEAAATVDDAPGAAPTPPAPPSDPEPAGEAQPGA